MSLRAFLAGGLRNEWIAEPDLPGMAVYVRKSVFFPGVVELASVTSDETTPGAYWRFLRRYAREIPFYAEQTLNPRLADLYRKLGWRERSVEGIPQFASPLMVEQHEGSDRFRMWFR